MRLSAPLVAFFVMALPSAAWAQSEPAPGERAAAESAPLRAATESAPIKVADETPKTPCPAATKASAVPWSSGFWVGAALQGDLAFMGGGAVCDRESQTSGAYSCFRSDREQYVGVPAPSEPVGFAMAYGTTRVALTVERAIGGSFTAGGRLGIVLGGGPTPAKGPTFLPIHLEARAAYWIGRPPSLERGLRGFVSLAAGLAQMDASRAVEVEECRPEQSAACTPATNEQPGGPNPSRQVLDAYKKGGQAFVGLGVGVLYSFVPGSAAAIELKAAQFFPSAVTTLSPTVSYVFQIL